MSAKSTTVIDSSGNSSQPSSSSPDEENTDRAADPAPPPHQEVAVDVIQREIACPIPLTNMSSTGAALVALACTAMKVFSVKIRASRLACGKLPRSVDSARATAVGRSGPVCSSCLMSAR